MKRVTKKIISVVLAVMMMVSVLSVASSAATKKTVGTYKVYLDLGDSISTGFSLKGYNRAKHWSETKGSYPSYISDWVGAKKSYWYSQDGFRTSEIRQLLDTDYSGDLMTDAELPKNTENYWNSTTLKKYRSAYRKAVKKADIITLNIGFNDIWYPIIYMAHTLGLEDGETDYAQLIKNYALLGVEATQAMYQELAEFYVNYAAIVNTIYELNPDVTLVTLSTYNPTAGWSLPAENGVPFGKATTPIYVAMNAYKKMFENTYDNYYYVDVDDVEVRTATFPGLGNGFDPHPTEAGHKWMAKQILKVLPAKK